MKEITLAAKTAKSSIYIEENLLDGAKGIIDRHFKYSKIHVITDSNVHPLYFKRLASQFDNNVTCTIITAGEQSKTLAVVEGIYGELNTGGITKSDLIIALGGGVVGDITGFVSATYLRGVAVCQIPTSLLAQVDSSVGGKCGVDLPMGKNLVGVINQPKAVIVDPSLLSTLPKRYFNDGLAEVIKYGFILDRSLLKLIDKDRIADSITEIVARCIKLKADIVEVDENDSGVRRILNFGHTIGHAIEKLGEFTRYSHGEAVAIGMVAAIRMGKKLGVTPTDIDEDWVVELLTTFNLPVSFDYEIKDIQKACLSDKKMSGSSLNLILLKDVGEATIVRIDSDMITNLLLAE